MELTELMVTSLKIYGITIYAISNHCPESTSPFCLEWQILTVAVYQNSRKRWEHRVRQMKLSLSRWRLLSHSNVIFAIKQDWCGRFLIFDGGPFTSLYIRWLHQNSEDLPFLSKMDDDHMQLITVWIASVAMVTSSAANCVKHTCCFHLPVCFQLSLVIATRKPL